MNKSPPPQYCLETVKGKDAANSTHFEVGRKVRQAIKDIGGTMPENLAPAEDVGKIARKLNKAITESAKRGG
jgi:DNA-damage-inducible protein D